MKFLTESSPSLLPLSVCSHLWICSVLMGSLLMYLVRVWMLALSYLFVGAFFRLRANIQGKWGSASHARLDCKVGMDSSKNKWSGLGFISFWKRFYVYKFQICLGGLDLWELNSLLSKIQQNKWGTRITPMVQWPDKSFTLGLSQALAWQRSGLMVRPTIQFR